MNQWLPETPAARLIGMDIALFNKRAARGFYGPLRYPDKKTIWVSVRGLELATNSIISPEHVAAAMQGKPLPPITDRDRIENSFRRSKKRRRLSVDEIGRRVVEHEGVSR